MLVKTAPDGARRYFTALLRPLAIACHRPSRLSHVVTETPLTLSKALLNVLAAHHGGTAVDATFKLRRSTD